MNAFSSLPSPALHAQVDLWTLDPCNTPTCLQGLSEKEIAKKVAAVSELAGMSREQVLRKLEEGIIWPSKTEKGNFWDRAPRTVELPVGEGQCEGGPSLYSLLQASVFSSTMAAPLIAPDCPTKGQTRQMQKLPAVLAGFGQHRAVERLCQWARQLQSPSRCLNSLMSPSPQHPLSSRIPTLPNPGKDRPGCNLSVPSPSQTDPLQRRMGSSCMWSTLRPS